MLLKLWLPLLILTSSLAAIGCKGALPIRPHLDVGMVSAPEPSEADPTPFQGCIFSDGARKVWHLSWKECDKKMVFDKDQMNAFAAYVLELEKMAQQNCGMKDAPATAVIEQLSRGYNRLEQTRLR